MAIVVEVMGMLRARRKLWMLPLYLITAALEALMATSKPSDRPVFIYTLF
jgi:hypothetical protein